MLGTTGPEKARLTPKTLKSIKQATNSFLYVVINIPPKKNKSYSFIAISPSPLRLLDQHHLFMSR